MDCQKMDLIKSLQRSFFKVWKVQRVKFGYFATFYQFSLKRFDNVFFMFVHNFLGMILINFKEMDSIELFKMSVSRSEMSGLAHFPIIIDIIQ